MEKYNRYNESLDIECGCNNPKPKVKNDCCCGGENLPSHNNELEVIVKHLQREVVDLMKSTDKRLLCQDKKIAETMVYIKNNLSNSLRLILNSMLENGELEELIKTIIIDNVSTLQSQIDDLDEEFEELSNNQAKLYRDLDNRTVANTNDIKDLKTRVDELEKDEEVTKDMLVTFGDSWTAPTVSNAVWSNTLATNLGLDLKNYAVDGAGFVVNNYGLISSQVALFNNDIISNVVNKDKVKYVVVCGGINDFRNNVTYSNLVTAIKSVFTTLKTLVPNAKLLFVANCQYPYQVNQFSYWKNVKANLTGIDTLILINKIPMSYYDSTYFHLTQQGQNLFIAQNVQALLEGGEVYTESDTRIVEFSDIKYTYVLSPINDNTAEIYIEIKCTNTTNTLVRYNKPTTNFIDLPYSSGFYNASGVALNKSIGVMYQDPSVLELDRTTATSTYYPMWKNIRV